MGLLSTLQAWRKTTQKFAFAVFMLGFSKLYNIALYDRKCQLFSHLHTMTKRKTKPIEMLEIGAGTGTNFGYYPKGCHLTCLDPNVHSLAFLRKGHNDFAQCKSVIGYCEDMSMIPDTSIDAVVSTLVMCSVSDVDKSLAEVKRVLRPGGVFLFMEHTIYDATSGMRRVQWLFRRLWKLLLDGCNITRDIAPSIHNAGFSHVQLDAFLVPYKNLTSLLTACPLMRPHIVGCATK